MSKCSNLAYALPDNEPSRRRQYALRHVSLLFVALLNRIGQKLLQRLHFNGIGPGPRPVLSAPEQGIPVAEVAIDHNHLFAGCGHVVQTALGQRVAQTGQYFVAEDRGNRVTVALMLFCRRVIAVLKVQDDHFGGMLVQEQIDLVQGLRTVARVQAVANHEIAP